jgi:hypothetical protein
MPLNSHPSPPAMVSEAFLSFMHARTELSKFVDFYHRTAKQAMAPCGEMTDKALYEEYMGHSVFFVENYLTRIADFFDTYLEQLIICVCAAKRDFLPDRQYRSATDRLKRLGNPDPEDGDIVFEAATRFAQNDKSEIDKYFIDTIGFSLSAAAGKSWTESIFLTKIRNLIVHKASVMDERFVQYAIARACPFEIGIGTHLLMPERWVMELSMNVDSCVVLIDGAIDQYIQIEKRNRYSHFWLPRHVWASPLNDDKMPREQTER